MAATGGTVGGTTGAPTYPAPGSTAPSAPPSPSQVRPLTTADLGQAIVFLTNAMGHLSQTVQVLATQIVTTFPPFPFHIPITDHLPKSPVRIPSSISHVTFPFTVTLLFVITC